MALNWKEIQLILKEADLEGSKIQGVIQNSFHSVTWELYSRERGRYSFYTEIGTPQSRMHIVSIQGKVQKTKKLQRFEQFARKNLEGSVIVSCRQLPFDRAVQWDLVNHDRELKVFIRLYSGPGANIIVTDKDMVILDLLLRRPGRDEISSKLLTIEERTESQKEFSVRPYEGRSFNEFIERTCREEQQEDLYGQLVKQVNARMDHELGRLSNSIRSAEKSIESTKDYEELRYEADLLSANSYQIQRGQDRVTIKDWERNTDVTIKLDKSLTPGANVQAYYDRYQKAKGTYENAQEELERLQGEYNAMKAKFEKALEDTGDEEANIRKLKSILDKTSAPVQVQTGPGIRCTSGGFQLLVGRNAKENDDLLRHHAKGNDMWLHTRDFPGGYVFIKYRKEKSIPLEVLLDAANLAVLYSKGRNSTSVDLYYTQVKYLRRAKDGKTGLVLPSQEKNLTIKPDKARIARLLPKEEA